MANYRQHNDHEGQPRSNHKTSQYQGKRWEQGKNPTKQDFGKGQEGGYERKQRQPAYGKSGNRSYQDRDGQQPAYRQNNSRGYQGRDGQQPAYRQNNNRGYQDRDGQQPAYRQNNSRSYQDRDGQQPAYRRQESKPYQQQNSGNYEAAPEQLHADEAPYFIMGRNAVREALKSGRSIDRILIVKEQDGSLRELVNLARDRKVILREVDRKKLDELCMPFGHGGKPGNHQGIVAMVPDVEYCELEDILAAAKVKGEAPFVIVLQEISDPHNLGSILRSAACAGAHGVVIPKRRAASVTPAVAKASAGAVEYVKVARVVNLSQALDELKKAGLWIAGADMQGAPMGEVNLCGPLALVIGNEGEGLGRLVKESCDHLVRIPMQGPIDSLNASVAAAVLMFEKRRQDAIGQPSGTAAKS